MRFSKYYSLTEVPGWPGAYRIQPGPVAISRQGFCEGLGPEVKRLILPETVESLEPSCFENCRHLREVGLPESIESIGKRAFANCVSLERIVIPDSVKKLGKTACFGTRPRRVSLPAHLCPEGLTPEEVLGIPDEHGFIGEGDILWGYVGPPRATLMVPDKYARVQWEEAASSPVPRFDKLILPDRLAFLDIPIGLADSISFPSKYLQRQDFLPARLTASLICGKWRGSLTADDAAALFLFQKPTLSRQALDESGRFSRLEFAQSILNMLPETGVRDCWKRASVWLTGFDFGPDDRVGAAFARKMCDALGLSPPSVWVRIWDYALEDAGIRLTPELAGRIKSRDGRTGADAALIKAALAPYAARGSDICRWASRELGPFRRVAEEAAGRLDPVSLSEALDGLLPHSRAGNPQQAIPYIRYGNDSQMRSFLRPCSSIARAGAIRNGNCSRKDACLLWKKNLALSNTAAALEFAMRANHCADESNVSCRHPLDLYLRERQNIPLPSLEFGVDGGKKVYVDHEGKQVLVLSVENGEILLGFPGERPANAVLRADAESEERIGRDIRKTYEIRSTLREAVRDLIADRWIDGRSYDPALWKRVFGEDFFSASAHGVVWRQGDATFMQTGAALTDVAAGTYKIDDGAPITVAYPSDMPPEEAAAWRRVLQGLQDPALPQQLNDPVYSERDISPDRYAGCLVTPETLPFERDRMFLWETIFGKNRSLSNGSRIDLDEFLLQHARLGTLRITAMDRETNHLLYLLDLLTLETRFQRDDASLAPLLEAASDDQFIKWRSRALRTEGLNNLRALVLEESEKRFRKLALVSEFCLP